MIIYRIYHRETGKSYVGQTVHPTFNGRYSGGRWWDITDNPILKNAHAKHGANAFEVEILESNVESIERLNELEEMHADRLNVYAPTGYNLRKCGDSRRLLEHQIEIIRKNRSKSYTLRNIDTWELVEVFNLKAFCREHGIGHPAMYNMVNENLGIIVFGGYCLAKRTREEVENRDCRRFKDMAVRLINEAGEVAVCTNIKKFAKDRGLEHGSLYKLIKGEMLYYRGWRLPERSAEPKSTERSYELIGPDNTLRRGVGVTHFCKDNNLRYLSIIKVLAGDMLEHRGWRLPTTTEEQLVMRGRRQKISMDMVSPEGEVVHTDNLRMFCHQRKLRYESFYQLASGACKTAYGWAKV